MEEAVTQGHARTLMQYWTFRALRRRYEGCVGSGSMEEGPDRCQGSFPAGCVWRGPGDACNRYTLDLHIKICILIHSPILVSVAIASPSCSRV